MQQEPVSDSCTGSSSHANTIVVKFVKLKQAAVAFLVQDPDQDIGKIAEN